MTYEYKELKPFIEGKGKTLISEFNELGKHGWKFIFEKSGIYYFIREG